MCHLAMFTQGDPADQLCMPSAATEHLHRTRVLEAVANLTPCHWHHELADTQTMPCPCQWLQNLLNALNAQLPAEKQYKVISDFTPALGPQGFIGTVSVWGLPRVHGLYLPRHGGEEVACARHGFQGAAAGCRPGCSCRLQTQCMVQMTDSSLC